jgi:heat shock protein HslJ
MTLFTRRTATVAISVLMGLALTACTTGSPSSAASPAASGGLTGKTWQWSGGTTSNPTSQHVVPDPENYTITFNPDDTFNAKADCNQVSGAYSAGSDGALSITPGPSTLAACPEGSQGDLFVAQLTAASSWKIDGSTLTITDADAATMQFD